MTSTPDRQPESLEGALLQVLFVNEASGYAVARIEVEDEQQRRREVSIVGPLLGLEVGVWLRLSGHYESHRRYGEQFRVESFEVLKPASLTALERYLSSGQIRGVGPKLARRMVEHFGEALGQVLDEEPHRLREIRGLGPMVVRRIIAAWQDSSGLRELMVFLRGHGISAAHARRIHKQYGTRSLEVIRADPYLLARTVSGIGFRTADAVAEQLGIPRNSPERARAALLYLLERFAEDGHVFAPLPYLENQLRSALEMDPDLAEQAVADLAQTGELVVENGNGPPSVYLKRLHQAEVDLARRLRALSAGRPMGQEAVERALAAADRVGDIELTEEQRAALRIALRAKLAVITGGPGTGKTTLLRWLLAALDRAGIKPMLAAPTGRAARRLADATGREARTIHRLLEYSPDAGSFIRNEGYPLRTSYVVIDEASMMDLELAASLCAALMPNCSLILVGDRDQLPSVGPGAVLKDLIASGLAPVVELHEVYRQARQSLIIANAHRVNRGQMVETTNDPAGDFFLFERNAPEEIVATIKQLVGGRLIGRFDIRDAFDIQVISPMNRGTTGVHSLNLELQQLLNPNGREIRFGERVLREGDRVIQLRNNYDKQVFNGDIGRIVAADPEAGAVEVSFEETRARYDGGELDELALAYAISVHKSQGSQYRAVVVVIHQSHYLMLRRNLLYTAITRAERVCVLVGSRAAIAQAVRNEEERRRMSHLAERLHID